MKIWQQIIVIFVLVLIATWASAQIRKHILPKYRIKKLYVLIATILLFLVYVLLGVVLQNFQIVQYIMLTIICTFMMTYFELLKMEKEEKNKPIVGRPMAKPHRANKE